MTTVPIFDTVATLRKQVAAWQGAGETVVLVPTMGALHEGHRALVAYAKTLGQRTIVSIFVNPTQFGPNEDFAHYPRTIEDDLAVLFEIGADAAYIPPAEVMYPNGFSTHVVPGGPSQGLCGEFRPGHFTGVATVVTKLINQSQTDIALFGEKDFQQLQVIRRVVKDLDIDVEIIGMPTIREADGLALSSRNRYLNPTEREIAPRLYSVLTEAAVKLPTERDPSLILTQVKTQLEHAGFEPVQYVELCDQETLQTIASMEAPARILAAAYLGRTRLIDNVPVEPKTSDATPRSPSTDVGQKNPA